MFELDFQGTRLLAHVDVGRKEGESVRFAQTETGTFRYQPFRDVSDPMDASAPLYTGWIDAPFGGSPNVNGDITLKQDLPLPFTILALVPKYNVTADEV